MAAKVSSEKIKKSTSKADIAFALLKKKAVLDMLAKNEERLKFIHKTFNPITGEGSTGKRVKVEMPYFPLPVMYLPEEMLNVPLVRQLMEFKGDIDAFLEDLESDIDDISEEQFAEDRQKVIKQFIKIRCRYDFAFWAAFYVKIKNKDGGEDVLFRLTRPQRKFVERLEALRKANKPIRIILLKARQWGGSTTSQLYMAWLQLVHKYGLNSLIIAHQSTGSDEIKDMFDRMIKEYPVDMLHKLNEDYDSEEPKLVGVGHSGNIHRVPQRGCNIKIGTAQNPDSCRGGSYNLVHLSEVGLWKATEQKKPEDIVRSACSGVLYKPYTMIVYESTANGTGNFFQKEYDDARKGFSQFESMFISWFDIDLYSLDFENSKEKAIFAAWLYQNRKNNYVGTSREECGKYLYSLWQKGATLEAINWYIHERAKFTEHAAMASEYPSDDVEAFAHSGRRVFDPDKVEDFKASCRVPLVVGDLYGKDIKGKECLEDLHFVEDHQGLLSIWNYPEIEEEEKIKNRYLVIVDIGGRSEKADWSVIVVIDRLFMMEPGGKPVVVAQWYGHVDMHILAWKAAQIAKYYDDALLVIESNTLETKDKNRDVEGDQSEFILNKIKDVYDNLYARKQSEEDIKNKCPVKYGWHTNVATKPKIISLLVEVICEGLYIERDEQCLNEYLTYEKDQSGAYNAINGKHDDLLMTRAIGLWICFREMDMPIVIKRVSNFHGRTRKKVVSAATI